MLSRKNKQAAVESDYNNYDNLWLGQNIQL
jgi:hypothetical protein